MERDGATLVGMTGMPEAALARELELALRGDLRRRQPRGGARRQRATRSRWRASRRCWRAAMDKVRALLDHVAPPPDDREEARDDPRHPAHGRSAAAAARRAPVAALRHARARRAARGPARHDGGAERRRARGAADRRAAAGRDLRRRAQPALSRRRAGALHRARQSGADAAVRRDGGGLGGLPVGARAARRRAALHAAALRGLRSAGPPIRREVDGFHARVVQHECDHLRRHPLSDAHARPVALRLHRRAVSRSVDDARRVSRRREAGARPRSGQPQLLVERRLEPQQRLLVVQPRAVDQEHVLGALAQRVDLARWRR